LGGNLTRASIAEYAAAVRPRYRKARRAERSGILSEFCTTTGYHRKAAIRLLNRGEQAKAERRGRPQVYDERVRGALAEVWEASGCLCSKRLVPFLPELLDALERHGELGGAAEVRALLLQLAPATVDRLLAARRRGLGPRPFTQSGALAALKAQVPVRTWGEWAEAKPGEVQADLVAHCGESGEGHFLLTLTVVDAATSWTELEGVAARTQDRVQAAFHRARGRFPFPLGALHTDNGGEFLNGVLYPYCQRTKLRFTRGRPYRKNDQAYVEQKNGAVVRRLIGYDRYSAKAALVQLTRLYQFVRLDLNYLQPVRKLIAKERVGNKVVKRFDAAKTPYQRALAAGILTAEQRERLAREYRLLNPIRLRHQIQTALDELWKLAETGRKAAAGAAAGGSEGGSKP
jgi:hypothetical protein